MIAAGTTARRARSAVDDRDYQIAHRAEPRPIQQRFAPERRGRTCVSATRSGGYLAPWPVVPCPTVPRRSSRRSWRLVRRSSRRSWRPVRRSARRSLRLSRRSWRRSIPTVWASASGAVSTAAGTPMPNAAPSPRIQKALRREIVAASIFSRMAKPHLGFLHGWRAAKSRGRAS